MYLAQTSTPPMEETPFSQDVLFIEERPMTPSSPSLVADDFELEGNFAPYVGPHFDLYLYLRV